MKKFIVLLLVSQCAFSLFGQSDSLDYYADRFKRATSVEEQLNVLRVVSSENIDDSASFFGDALKRLLWVRPDVRTLKEKIAFEESLRIIMDQISQQQYTEAAPDLWRVMERFSNPIIKSDALITLGAIGATDYLNLIIHFLDQNTLYPTYSREDGERLAYGAISALGSFGDASAYMPVFAAANGWYSTWLKTYAEETLEKLAEDPSEELIKGLNGIFYSYQVRYQALIALDESSASDESKSQGAQAALKAGWTYSPLNSKEAVLTRKRAITMLGEYGDVSDDQVYALLRRSYTQSYDLEERFAVVKTLSQLATDEAVQMLVSFIADISDSHRYGTLRDTEERLIRALIPALHETGSSEGDSVLKEITLVDWTSNIHELARQTISDSAK
jgi:HEAT repeat protein